jgi:hypothetical protein
MQFWCDVDQGTLPHARLVLKLVTACAASGGRAAGCGAGHCVLARRDMPGELLDGYRC